MKRVILDTNIIIDWLNRRAHEHVVLGPGRLRYLSSIVLMELRVGATTRRAERAVDAIERGFASAHRVLVPTIRAFDDAGRVLQELRRRGREVRQASLVNDALIAMSARSIGAAVTTRDAADFELIRSVREFEIEAMGASEGSGVRG